MKAVKKVKSKSPRMKSYDSFDHWKKDQTKKAQSLIQPLRKLVNDCSLPLEEAVKWSNGCWVKDNLPIVYIYAMKEAVQFGFPAGSMMKEPKKRFAGNGKYVRFIVINSKEDIDTKYFTSLIEKAIKIKYR